MKPIITLVLLLFFSSVLSAQSCIDCSLIDPNALCTQEWAPVCGCDGVTYSNDCMAINSGGVSTFTEGECPINGVFPCSDLSGIDFGICAAVIGYGSVNGQIVAISGCGTMDANGIDYAQAIYSDPDFLLSNCLCEEDSVPESIYDLSQFSLTIGASPVQDDLRVFYASAEQFDMELIDITGRSVLETSIISGQFTDVSGMGNGLYILILKKNKQAFYSTRLVIKR